MIKSLKSKIPFMQASKKIWGAFDFLKSLSRPRAGPSLGLLDSVGTPPTLCPDLSLHDHSLQEFEGTLETPE